ncbi:phenylacetate-CoA oxygenase subunit PaaJ [Chitinophaga horti]|uniref:Phenylacetate-CoA oxygenase subunit PaaJ n=1 Tax=Chitinophaga horti TaxID=2920382 RepID=A0ABY6IZG7_9BACT|nr:1,2-phenylacetyl-CoA epoxidase subunit PaaD [Chitinophaga horti]UYQ92808.1 phenylacetate-CoA oxygenase subunit PaaJ [Chitinophaga horti]
MITKDHVYKALEQVMDPEVPVLNVLELGMITDISIADGYVRVDMIPTFAACPAVNYIRNNIKTVLEQALDCTVEVNVNKQITWNSNRISEAALEKLRTFGLAAPQRHNGDGYVELMSHTPCPHCSSTDTYLRSPFGSTLCRAMHYCKSCGNLFEQFKPVE